MTEVQQRGAAKAFAAYWAERGDEKQETARFWIDLLQNVYGVEDPSRFIQFEVPVKLDHVSYIDGFISTTRVLIEQKSADVDLRRGQKQSDGAVLNPYQQARRYAGYLPFNQTPRWIVVCNFLEFQIHDMNRPNDDPEIVRLADLEREYPRLQFLVDTGDASIKKEMEVSLQAGEIVGVLYDALLKQYKDPESAETLKSLNALCVRLVFCLYAEDAGIFGGRGMFHSYLKNHAGEARRALMDLFQALDTRPEDRDPYMDDDLAAFPYVNGGLFADESVVIPRLDQAIVDLILQRASEDFDWSAISPTIFGAVFESTLNPETRRSGGMHYTSIENIHKVIDPLFLDALQREYETALSYKTIDARKNNLANLQKKLASLTFLDPACGSGNFLTETYLSLRRLENKIIAASTGNVEGQIGLLGDFANPIQVSIHQFYGIEINDFAVTVAKTALWIAESQMLKETEDIIHRQIDFLPLRSYANITEGNALRLDWESVVPKRELNYIMGNPPFVGKKEQSKEQKNELITVWENVKGVGNLDYVTGWYKKAARFIQGSNIHVAFVSTNSITQGEQVPIFWRQMIGMGVHIDFAYRTFRWDSEANIKAHVHCVIIGFSVSPSMKIKRLYTAEKYQEVENINPYLVNAPSVLIENRSQSICHAPPILYGSMPIDNGHLILEREDVDELLAENPENKKFIKKYVGGVELIQGKERWCLWLKGSTPKDLQSSKIIMNRIRATAEFRKTSKRPQTLALAQIPALFGEIRQPDSEMLVIPKVSSENRRYIPISYVSPEIIVNGSALIVPGATLYHFGILISNVHMAWMRTVAGRMKSDYQYSGKVVYNNFPWPTPTGAQRAAIEQTAQMILDARALYPDSSLADLYDETTMPAELRKAHQQNDRAVMRAYGFDVKTTTETSCVAELMRMYQKLTEHA